MSGAYERKGKKYKIEEVLPFVDETSRRKLKMDFDGDMIKITSDRLRTFKTKGTVCVKCGLEASYLVKERSNSETPFHFNMYGVNSEGEEVLFTKDHIVPKSRGGSNHLENYQTMCCRCNEEKGNKI